MGAVLSWTLERIAAFGRLFTSRVESFGAMLILLGRTFFWVFAGPFTGKTRFRKTVFPLMHQIGVKSLGIVCLVSTLVGAILVLQTADQFERFGAKNLVPQMVGIAVIRELGPLMTAIVISGRVGAAFTAGLGSMVINEEVLALRTMGINPIGYLVAPRYIALAFMLPCLTVYSYLLGNAGGFVVGMTAYNIPFWSYYSAFTDALATKEMVAGLVKAFAFASIICMVSCYNALTVRGGPEGVGRNTMVSVVNSLVAIIVADAIFTWFFAKYLYD